MPVKKAPAPPKKKATAAPPKKRVQRGGFTGSFPVAPYYGAHFNAGPFPTAVNGGDITATQAMGRAAWAADGLGGAVFGDYGRVASYPPMDVTAGSVPVGQLDNNYYAPYPAADGPSITGGGGLKKKATSVKAKSVKAVRRLPAAPKRKK